MSKQNGRTGITVLNALNQLFGQVNGIRTIVKPDQGRRSSRSNKTLMKRSITHKFVSIKGTTVSKMNGTCRHTREKKTQRPTFL